jgi:hypothetical protein
MGFGSHFFEKLIRRVLTPYHGAELIFYIEEKNERVNYRFLGPGGRSQGGNDPLL